MPQIYTNGGEFNFPIYDAYNSDPDTQAGERINVGADAIIQFFASSNSDDVRLVQLIHPQGQWINDRERDRAANGWSVDTSSFSPWYGTTDNGQPRPIGDLHPNATQAYLEWLKQNDVKTLSAFGYRRGQGSKPAMLIDTPRHMAAIVGDLVQVRLVTIAVDVQHSAYLGGAQWGFDLDQNGTVTARAVKLAFKTNPAGDYLQALENWNQQPGNTAIVLPP